MPQIKIFNPRTIIFSLAVAVFLVISLLPSSAEAVTGGDCNSTNTPQKCIDEYRGCEENDHPVQCRENVVKKYKKDSNQCGNYDDDSRNVKTKFDFGCLGEKGPDNLSPIKDLAYAIIRFLSVGVGIVITLAVILAGIQYSASEGNAEATQKAKQRIISAMIGLAIYIFAFSIMQYFIPGGIFKPGLWLIEPDVIIRFLSG